MVNFGFSPELDAQLVNRIDEICKRFPRPWIAAFDADGTLWNTDLGEAFFQYQIDHCNLDTLPADPWKHYEDLKLFDHKKAYLWLAQISEGQPFARVQEWAAKAVQKHSPLPIFEPQKNLIAYLRSRGFEVFIVTASVQWAVVPAAHLVGIESTHVLGIQTAIEDGIVTTEQFGPITWRDGKATSLLARTGSAPHFCSGNTSGDTALLKSSQHTRLAVCAANNVGELAETERALQEIARSEQWLTHQF